MNEELKELEKQWKKIEEGMGINALEKVKDHYFTLWRKIEDLIKSRDLWKNKYMDLKSKEKVEKTMDFSEEEIKAFKERGNEH